MSLKIGKLNWTRYCTGIYKRAGNRRFKIGQKLWYAIALFFFNTNLILSFVHWTSIDIKWVWCCQVTMLTLSIENGFCITSGCCELRFSVLESLKNIFEKEEYLRIREMTAYVDISWICRLPKFVTTDYKEVILITFYSLT